MNLIGYNEYGKPVGITVRFTRGEESKLKMVRSTENYLETKSVSLAGFYDELLIELKKQLLDYVYNLHLEDPSKRELYTRMIRYVFAQEPSIKKSIAEVYNSEYVVENEERFGNETLVIAKQPKGQCAIKFLEFRKKLIEFGYL